MFKFKKAGIIKCLVRKMSMTSKSKKTTKKNDKGFKTREIAHDVLIITWHERVPSPIGALKDVQVVIVREETIR